MNKLSKTREEKVHYKMYKAGKHWLFAGLATISLGIGLGLSDGNAKANTADTISATEAVTANGGSAADQGSDAQSQAVSSTSTSSTQPDKMSASSADSNVAVSSPDEAKEATSTAVQPESAQSKPEPTATLSTAATTQAKATDVSTASSQSASVTSQAPAQSAVAPSATADSKAAATPHSISSFEKQSQAAQVTTSDAPTAKVAVAAQPAEQTTDTATAAKETSQPEDQKAEKPTSTAKVNQKTAAQPTQASDKVNSAMADELVNQNADQVDTQADLDMDQLTTKGTTVKVSAKLQPKLAGTAMNKMMFAAAAPVEIVKSGNWGTSKWEFDSTGTLTIHQGQLSSVTNTNNPLKDFAADIKKIMIDTGTTAPVDSSYLFSQPDGSGLPNVTYIQGENLITKNTTNFARMFQNDQRLVSVDVSKWDVRKAVMPTSYPDDYHLGAMYQMFDGASSLTSLDLTGWDTFSFKTAGAFGWTAMQEMLRGTTNLWKITVGPKTFLASNKDLAGSNAIPDAPGKYQQIVDPLTNLLYGSTNAQWQLVGTGTDHHPQGPMMTATALQNKINDGDYTQPITFVWAQTQLETATVNFIRSLDGVKLSSASTTGPVGTQLALTQLNTNSGVEKGSRLGSAFVTANLPKGYHLTPDIRTSDKQPTALTYGTDKTINVYVESDVPYYKAVTVNKYEMDDNGKPTNITLGAFDIFAFAGDVITIKYNDPRWSTASFGFEVIPQADVVYTVPGTQTPSKPVPLYFKKIDVSTITVNYVNTKTGETIGTSKPIGKRYDTIDLTANSDRLAIPVGYHYSTTPTELGGRTQPTSLDLEPTLQTATVYVSPNEIKTTDTGAITVHYYLADSTTKVQADRKVGGFVGETVTISAQDADQTVAGYTLVPNQPAKSVTLDGQPKEATFYYTANDQKNITITYLDGDSGNSIGTSQPDGHTGETLQLGSDSAKLVIPAGYHYATAGELTGDQKQPSDLTWTTTPQTTNVYVIGNPVKAGDPNAVTVHYYLENTTQLVKADDSLGGKVGGQVTVNPATIAGYRLVDGQTAKAVTLTAENGQTATFFYQADEQKTITVSYVDTNTNKEIGNSVPTGHTNEKLDLGSTSDQISIPAGYHYATPAELQAGQTQPTALTWTTDQQATKVYVVGNEVKPGDQNAITVHYYLTNTTQSLKADDSIGGVVGSPVTINPAEIKGYTGIADQAAKTLTLAAAAGQIVTFYYTADDQNNITVSYVDPKTGDQIGDSQTPAGHTGEKLDLGKGSQQMTIPTGYHYATPEELPQGTQQPTTLTWTTNQQATKVYVVGNPVKSGDANAVTVHYYLDQTTTSLKADDSIGGIVGESVTVSPAEIKGYTLVAGQTAQTVKLDAQNGQTRTFYYQADAQTNITVIYVDPNGNQQVGNPQKPAGHTGEELDLGKDSQQLTIPAGYHYATPAELPSGVGQPENPKWTTADQTTQVYVIGNEVRPTDPNAITVHYYVENTTKALKADDLFGGQIGTPITVSPAEIKGYTLVAGQTVQTVMLDVQKGQSVSFYYQADDQSNITIHYVDTDTGKSIGTSNPAGHTDGKLDLSAAGSQLEVPAGYHYATPAELKESQTQPTALTWTTEQQDTNVYITGNVVQSGDTNAITVHHYLANTTTPLAADDSLGGKVGGQVTASPATIKGYTLVAGQKAQMVTLKADAGQTVTFYYQADVQTNITVTLVDTNTGTKVGDGQKPAGHTGETLDLGTDSKQINIPAGYHYATPSELTGDQKQPTNLTWTTDDQTTNLYIVGNDVKAGDHNAVTVHYYLDGTNQSLKADESIGGKVGSPVTVNPADIKGYTLVAGQQPQTFTLRADAGQAATFYYAADNQTNITITYVDTNTGKEIGNSTPAGHTAEKLDLGKDSSQIDIPAGYHHATPSDLKSGQQQPADLTWTTDQQTTQVYVVGNLVNAGDHNAVSVHYYLDNTTQALKPADSIGGVVGSPVTVNPAKIDGYTLVAGQQPQTVTLTIEDGQAVVFYYTADDQHNIKVTYVDPNTQKEVGTSTPDGHTNEKLDLGKGSQQLDVPAGYHYATPAELPAGTNQPGELTWTTTDQATTVYVIGNEVESGDVNAVTVHHYLVNTTTSLKADESLGGRVGSEVTASPANIAGYTAIAGQAAKVLTLDAKTGQTVAFYYQANDQNNIMISYVDTATGKEVTTSVPTGHTGEKLDLGKDSAQLDMPAGYHYATPEELQGDQKQPEQLTWTTDQQATKVYVVGNPVKSGDVNAITVHYYLDGTTKALKADDSIGGVVGSPVTIGPAVINGYTLVSGQTAQTLTLKVQDGQTVTFYYTADSQFNITVTYVDPKTGQQVGNLQTPTGHTGETLDLGNGSDKLDMPAGYHYATPEELKDGKQQPSDLTWTTDQQTTQVYVVGNEVHAGDTNAVTVHYYLAGTTKALKADESFGGIVGGSVTISPATIKGYTLTAGQGAQKLVLDAAKGQVVTFYYDADEQNNITIHYVDTDTGKAIGTSTPTGHTDEQLDLSMDGGKLAVPAGYHYATPTELITSQKQPSGLTWTTDRQDTTVYITGNDVKPGDVNAITVHHYLENTTTALQADQSLGGKVGGEVVVIPAIISGYELVAGQAARTVTLAAEDGQTVTFYYRAVGQNNITVSYVDVATGSEIGSNQPAGHTGEKLDLGADSSQITIPAGYHYATPTELKAGSQQPSDLTWTTAEQTANVYVVGNDVHSGDANAVTVHYYAEGTTKGLKADDSIGGVVGSPVTINPAVINGYTLVAGQEAKTVTLTVKDGQAVTFYYQANAQNNITVTYMDTNTGEVVTTSVPVGHTDEKLNLEKDSSQLDVPAGYHYATPAELKNGNQQPSELTWTTDKQGTTVYVVGNNVKPGDVNAVTVHYYLENTDRSLKADESFGGKVGSPVTISPAVINGYKLIDGQSAQTVILDVVKGQTVTYRYRAEAQQTITVNYLDPVTGNQIGDSQTPSGYTGEELNVGKDSDQLTIPAGYHYATPAELPVGIQQPDNPTWTPDQQTTNMYVVGNDVKPGDANAVTVHYYLAGTTKALKADESFGGKVGSPTTISPAVIDGYTVVGDQAAKKIILDAQTGQVLTFYYTANPQHNITVKLVDLTTGNEIGGSQKPAGHTGENLDLGSDSQQIEMPSGYHYATPNELTAGKQQPDDLTWTTADQETQVYIVGNDVKPADANAVVVHHYLAGTTQSLKEDDVYGGKVGSPVTVKPAKLVGYTLVAGQQAQTVTLQDKVGHQLTFYYQSDQQNNITVTYIDPQTGDVIGDSQTPAGHTGESLDLGSDSQQIEIPAGYHYATPEELKDGQKQPDDLTWKVTAQVTQIYVVGNQINPNDANAVVVHYYEKGTTTPVKPDSHIGGVVGQTVTVDPNNLSVPGYTLVAGQTPQSWQLTAKDGHEFVFYYTKNSGPTGQVTATISRPVKDVEITSNVQASSTQETAQRKPATQQKVKKGQAVYAVKKIYLYKDKNFTKKGRIAVYAGKHRAQRPMFVVIGYDYSKNGNLRYKVRDVNHLSKTNNLVGYITARWAYVRPVYYQGRHKTLTVINPRGVTAYQNKDLTGKVKNYKQGTVLHVKQIVHHNLTTRYVLENGQYITGNRKLVMMGNHKLPRYLKAKHTINRYQDANLSKQTNQRLYKGTKVKIQAYDYSRANDVTKTGTLRYQIAGGYVTGNSKFVKAYD